MIIFRLVGAVKMLEALPLLANNHFSTGWCRSKVGSYSQHRF